VTDQTQYHVQEYRGDLVVCTSFLIYLCIILLVIWSYVVILLSGVLKRIGAAFSCPTIHELYIFRRSSRVVNINVT